MVAHETLENGVPSFLPSVSAGSPILGNYSCFPLFITNDFCSWVEPCWQFVHIFDCFGTKLVLIIIILVIGNFEWLFFSPQKNLIKYFIYYNCLSIFI
jgi:hypothetical protein